MTTAPLLEVSGLKKHFPISRGIVRRRQVGAVRAVDGVDFTVAEGETLALVGESGCGKTTTGRMVLRLIDPTAGSVRFAGQELTGLGAEALRPHRREMQIIFQDPYGSLDPRMTVAQLLEEPLAIHGVGDRRSRRARVAELLSLVGLPQAHAARYAHEFSGGQRQRLGIARALALRPRLIVCDEPVSALDVSIQAQIINLLEDLQREFGLAYLFIAHDLGVVKHVADRVAVMYLGRIVETASKASLYAAPRHPYTQALLAAVPVPNPFARREPAVLAGEIPSPASPPPGCHFHTRCPFAVERCRTEVPALRELAPGHRAACHLAV
ncbi:ABC transporter ATP-binding protein [Allostella vacuolata]|nr:ABC transporter ATP-binding protein [Stella vacuolata]